MRSLHVLRLAEVATALGITSHDVADPERYVRALIRKHAIPFVRHGRTVKLDEDQLRLLADRMVQMPTVGTDGPSERELSELNPPAAKVVKKRAKVAAIHNPMAKRYQRARSPR